jgi:2-polyprenyl-3-methyl-5-hydroxy-6-metoxy-1,4-benzoquinol methylase
MRSFRVRESDEAWREFGRRDPYFGVLSHEEYHVDAIDDRTRARFFASGEEDVRRTCEWVERLFGPFTPARALDFGCGVGRLVIPLARRAGRVTGVDISEDMLAEARRNCEAQGVRNVDLVLSDDTLSRVQGEFDFIHSFIVFQHMPPERGEAILSRLLDHLAPDGIGALHFTFATRIPPARRAVQRIRKSVPLVHNALNLLQRRPLLYPLMQMNAYDMNRIYSILLERGCHQLNTRFTDHGGYIGAMLFFRKHELPLW